MQQTLLEMHLPEFRRGYQAGRATYFQTGQRITDMDVLDDLKELADERDFTDIHNLDLQYSVGSLIGMMSGPIIHFQHDELDHSERRRRLIDDIRRTLDKQDAESLIPAMRQLWEAQDRLAATLDAPTFQRVWHQDLNPEFRHAIDV